MTVANFLDKFGSSQDTAEPVSSLDELAPVTGGGLAKFIDKFSGVTEGYFFYDGSVELRFSTEEHIYYLVGELGQLIPQDGVTNVCHIIDKSNALVPWSAKMVVQKLLRTMPTVMLGAPMPEALQPQHTFDKVKECCSCGYRNNPAKLAHWETQWADHLRSSKEAATVETEYIPEMTLEDFTKIALEAKTAPRDAVDEASEIGHIAHTWLEYYLKAIIADDLAAQNVKLTHMPVDERAANCCYAALDWMKTHNVRWIETERKIYSKEHGYAGTMDGLALVDSCGDPGCCTTPFHDRLSVIDWKTSNYLYVEYLLQTAAYVQAYSEEHKIDIQDRWILRLGKDDGEFEPWHLEPEDFQEDFEGFLDALRLTRSIRLLNERVKRQKQHIREVRKEIKVVAKEKAKAEEKEAKAKAKEEKRLAKAEEKEREKTVKAEAKANAKVVKAGGTVVAPMQAHLVRRPTIMLGTPGVIVPVEKVMPRSAFELPVERL